MRLARAAVRLLIVVLLCLCPAPRAAANPGPDIIVDVPLRPITQPPVAQLSAYTCIATVECAGERCTVHTRQRYQLGLPAGVPATTLRIGLPAKALDRHTSPTDIVLLDEEGNALPIASQDADLHAVWEVPMERGQRRTLELSYSHPAVTGPFITWGWEVAALSAWGTVAAVHGEFVLPVPAADDALVRVDPHRANLLGERLWWDYESATEYPPHHVVVISPPTWERLQAGRAQGAHREVAALLRDVQAAARAEGIPGIDHWAEIIAELVAALEDDPGNSAARADLAAAYRALAEQTPEHRLNYLRLAARELATALEGSGSDVAPTREELATDLGRTYLQAADAASEADDPAGALEYLRLARETAGSQLAQELAGADELRLRWALKLAEMGRISEALAELDDLLAPGLRDNLLRYAPPLVAARTEVSLRPPVRAVRYDLEPYPPVAPQVRECLDDIVRRLQEVPCCEAILEEGDGALTLSVRAPARDGATLEACRRDIHAALAGEGPLGHRTSQAPGLAAGQELVAAIVAQPWQEAPTLFAREPGLWRDHLRYAEHIDTTALHDAWRSESEYVGWHLVELYSAAPADTRAQLERQVALAVMREQRQTWETFPSASQWAYEIAFADAGPPTAEWLVAWGQDRDLALARSIPHWDDIRAAALVVAALLVLPLLMRRLLRARRVSS
jgi:hypothetical protein